MNRRTFLKSVGSGVIAASMTQWDALLSAAPGPATTQAAPLNLLFITADDMNATMPGWMGNALKPTPAMDDFAATCHRFVNNRAAAPICQPSREAMMTGLVPHRSGGYGFNPVRPGTASLATILQSRGYYLAALNKIAHMSPKSVFPWDMTFDNCGKNPDGLARHFGECLAAAKKPGKPFFINCNITDPHRPFYGSGRNGDSPDAAAPQGMLARELKPVDVNVPAFLENLPDIQKEVSQYYNSVQRLDVSFGKVLAALRAAGEWDRTAIVFVSDHGMPFPFSKATVYHHGPWTPALLRWPNMPPPLAHEEFTGSIDLMPTLLDVLSIPKPDNLDGRSWLPLIAGEKEPNREYAFSHVNTVSSGRYFPQRLVQSSQFALCFAPWSDGKTLFKIESMNGLTYNAMVAAAKTDPRLQQRVDQYRVGIPLAFYDQKKDPDQRLNVLADPAYRNDLQRHQQALLEHMQRTQDPELENFKLVLSGKPADISGTTQRILQAEKELQRYRIRRRDEAG